MEEKLGILSGDYGKTGIGTVEKYGFKPIINSLDADRIDPFVDPEIFLGRTLNNLFGARHAANHVSKYEKFFCVAQDQVGFNPANYPDTEVIVYVHDLFPVTTVYYKQLTRDTLFDTIGAALLNFTHGRSARYINNADKVIAPCKTIAESLEKKTALEDVGYAYQGIDHLPVSNYQGERDIDFLYFGDLVHERKNPELVCKAFREANKRGYTTAYMNHSDNENIEADYKFIDVSVEKVAEVLKRSRFLLQPSYAEGFGRTPIEAQKYGCIPVVKENTQYFDVAKEVLGIKGSEWLSFEELNQLWSMTDISFERDLENPENYTWERFRKQIKDQL